MDITRRNFIKLAGAAGLLFSFGKVQAASNEKILVAYYSRTGEEYGLGNITKGNTAIVAVLCMTTRHSSLFAVRSTWIPLAMLSSAQIWALTKIVSIPIIKQ